MAGAALRATAPNERPPQALLTRTAARMDAAGRAPRPWLATRLGRPLVAITAAAALATTVAVMIAVVAPSGGNSAFAAVLDKIREMQSVRYRITAVEGVAGAEKGHDVMIETAAGSRLEEGSSVSVFRDDGMLFLDTVGKTAATFPPGAAEDRRQRRPHLLEQFRQADGSWGEPIAGKQVGTVHARGYRLTKKWLGEGDQESVNMRVYVDPATDLPMRVENEVRLSDDDTGHRMVYVLSDFEWGIEVDPAILSLEPPAGYRHKNVSLEAFTRGRPETSPAEAIAAGLRFYAGHVEGSLPSSLGGVEPMLALQAGVLDETAKKEVVALGMDAKLEFFLRLFGPWADMENACYELKNKNTSIHYLGKGLKAGDGSKIVAWWKVEKAGRAIAIYDDFSWKEIDEPADSGTPGG
jgi:hypothetical protein